VFLLVFLLIIYAIRKVYKACLVGNKQVDSMNERLQEFVGAEVVGQLFTPYNPLDNVNIPAGTVYGRYGSIPENMEIGRINVAYFTSIEEIFHDERCGHEIPDSVQSGLPYSVDGHFKGSLERLVDTLNSERGISVDGEHYKLSDHFNLVAVVYDDDTQRPRYEEGPVLFDGWPWDKNAEVIQRWDNGTTSVTLDSISHNMPSIWRRVNGNRVGKYTVKRSHEEQIVRFLYENQIDLLLTDSWLPIFTDEIIRRFYGHIVNLHPAITNPSNPNRVPGLTPTSDVYQRYLETGYNKTGATLHFTNLEIDDGCIIFDNEATVIDPVIQEDCHDENMSRIRILNYDTKQNVLESGLMRLVHNNQFRGSVLKIRDYGQLYMERMRLERELEKYRRGSDEN
jgi:folate-dependent phosphoribosylglycinamide formyltransferase PurN